MARKTPKKAVRKSVAPAQRTGKKNAGGSEPAEPAYKVGYKRPPRQYQWKPGQSGNPKGPPRGRTNLWPYFVQYLAMTKTQLAGLKRRKNLTMAQLTAIRAVEQIPKLGRGAARDLLLECFNRDEGKPTQYIQYDRPEALTPEECEEIRRAMSWRGEDDPAPPAGPDRQDTP